MMVMEESNKEAVVISPTVEVVSMQKDDEKNEIEELLKKYAGYRKRKRNDVQKTSDVFAVQISMYVEGVIAMLEVAAEEDAVLNRQSKPAVNKLKKLPLLTQVLVKKHLQRVFLDHGVLGLLKNWLEPLPDGSLPNVTVRTAILQILSDYTIDLGSYHRREQLKKSGIGKVIMFLSKSDEEITANKRLARYLVEKWSRPIYNISTRYDKDMRSNNMVHDEKRWSKKPAAATLLEDDFDLSEKQKSGKPSSKREYVTIPEALPMDFTVRPQHKINPGANNAIEDEVRSRLNKKLQRRTKSRRIALQAAKINTKGHLLMMHPLCRQICVCDSDF